MPLREIDELQTTLLAKLRSQPAGCSEYDLLKYLQAAQVAGFPAGLLFHDSLALFRMHFLLFHALYRLREQLWDSASGHLEISALQVRLGPYQAGTAALAHLDPLRDYYLDFNHLDSTTAAEVDAKLRWFWETLHAKQARQQALTVLGLELSANYATIKQRYRQLAARHHPDRGGDKTAFQQLQAAMAVLDKGERPVPSAD